MLIYLIFVFIGYGIFKCDLEFCVNLDIFGIFIPNSCLSTTKFVFKILSCSSDNIIARETVS